MLQERKGFFYEPELLDYKPVYARPDMNIMLKIIEAGAEKVAHQQDMLNKVEDSVRKTPAYLDQDVDYVGNVTKQIDTEISGMMDGTVDLLDPANTGKVMQIAKKYMYDPELAKITSRTGKISKSQEQIEAMRKAGKISAANYWEFNQSILNANSEFANSKKYNSDVNLHYDIVPYGDPRGENMETLKALPVHEISVNLTTPDGKYNYTRTIKAVSPQMQTAILYAPTKEAKEAAILENDRQLAAMFISNMSDTAKQQLIAEAKMQGANTPDQYQAYIQKSVLGVVDMANDADVKDSAKVADAYKLADIDYQRDIAKLQMQFRHAEKMQKDKIAADERAAKKKEEFDEKLAGYNSDPYRNVPLSTTVNYQQPSTLGIPFGKGSVTAIAEESTKTKQELNSTVKNVNDLNAQVQSRMTAVVNQLVAKGKIPASAAKNISVSLTPVYYNSLGKKVSPTAPDAIDQRYQVVSNIPKEYLKYPELAVAYNDAARVLNQKQEGIFKLQAKDRSLDEIQTTFKEAEKLSPGVKQEYEKLRDESRAIIQYRLQHTSSGALGFKWSEQAINEHIAKMTGGKASTREQWEKLVFQDLVAKSSNKDLKKINEKIDKTFNQTEQLELTEFFPNLITGVNSPITPPMYQVIKRGIINSLATDLTTPIYTADGREITDLKERAKVQQKFATTRTPSSAEDDTDIVDRGLSESYVNIQGTWYVKVVTADGKGYRMPIDRNGTPDWIIKLGLSDIAMHQYTKELESDARTNGKASIAGTDAVYDPAFLDIFSDGNATPKLIISGQAAPYNLHDGNARDVQIFYNTVNRNIGNSKVTDRESIYADGLLGMGFDLSQIQEIFRDHPQWFK